jgi:hypothetical protein
MSPVASLFIGRGGGKEMIGLASQPCGRSPRLEGVLCLGWQERTEPTQDGVYHRFSHGTVGLCMGQLPLPVVNVLG